MPFPRLTWAGLLIATLGWGFLLSYPLIAPHVVSESAKPEVHDPARFILIFGENAVVSGFGLALLGALEKALHLLMRLGSFGHARPLLPRQAHTVHEPAETSVPAPAVSSASSYAPPFISQRSSGDRSAGDIVTRGELNGRDYVLFRDGSVLIETLLGPRRFASISEAQEFIGAT
jgi:hypothetical protein